MSDTNLALMYKLDTLPQMGTLKSNYDSEEPDFTKSVNDQIDSNQKQTDQHFDNLISMYNKIHTRDASKPEEFLKTLKTGKKGYEDVKEFQKYWGDYYKFSKRLKNQESEFSNIYGGENWETFQGKGSFDSDVQTEIDSKPSRDLVKSQAMDLGSQIQEDNPYEANELILGPDSSYAKENDMIEDLDSLLVHHENSYRPRAEAGMKIHIPGQFTDDGQKVYKTYNEAVDGEERRYISDVIDAWYAHKHEDIANGRIGYYKQKFITELIQRDKTRVKKELITDANALKEIQIENRAKELQIKIKKDPGFLVDYILTYKGFHKNKFALARKEAFDTLIRGVEVGTLTRADIEPVLDYEFLANDSTAEKEHWVTARNYWRKDTRRLLKALSDSEKETYEENESMKDGAMKAKATDIIAKIDENDGPLTYKSVSDIQKDFMDKFGLRDPSQLPDIIKNLPYEGMNIDEDLDRELEWRHYTLNQRIEPQDIRGFTDPDLHKKWRDIARSQAGLTQGQSTRRNGAVSAEVTARTMESDVNKAKTPKWQSNYEQAIREYDTTYNGIIANGGTDEDAHREAMKAVNDGLWKEISPGVYQWDQRQDSGFDVKPARAINKIVRAIGKDNDLILSNQPWDGESPHLKEAAKYLEKSRKGIQVSQPAYYRQIAKQIGMNTERLILNRLESTGVIKENEFTIPEEKNLSAEHQQLLIKPSYAKTARVFLEQEDTQWMLDTIANPVAEANGGYLAIRNQVGQYESIEEAVGKPIGEVTMSDIFDLIGSGYTNIGRYDLTPEGLFDVVVATGVGPEALFNEEAQDFIVLGRLRQKANKANQYRTIDQRYRRLVNIPREDREIFIKEVGELPEWLDLDTLQADAARELVNMLIESNN